MGRGEEPGVDSGPSPGPGGVTQPDVASPGMLPDVLTGPGTMGGECPSRQEPEVAGVPPPLIHPCFRPPSSSSFFSGILNSPQTLSILNSCPPITQIFAQPTCTQPPPSSRPSLGHCDSRNFQIPMPAFIHPSRGSSSGSLKLLLHLPTPPSQSPPLPPQACPMISVFPKTPLPRPSN